jgi:hypothetical protein
MAKVAKGFAPTEPIRVHMVQDEEIIVGMDLEEANVDVEKPVGTKVPPPAYGIWRESVVCLLESPSRFQVANVGNRKSTRNFCFGSE